MAGERVGSPLVGSLSRIVHSSGEGKKLAAHRSDDISLYLED